MKKFFLMLTLFFSIFLSQKVLAISGDIYISRVGFGDNSEFIEIHNSGPEIQIQDLEIYKGKSKKPLIAISNGTFKSDSYITLSPEGSSIKSDFHYIKSEIRKEIILTLKINKTPQNIFCAPHKPSDCNRNSGFLHKDGYVAIHKKEFIKNGLFFNGESGLEYAIKSFDDDFSKPNSGGIIIEEHNQTPPTDPETPPKEEIPPKDNLDEKPKNDDGDTEDPLNDQDNTKNLCENIKITEIYTHKKQFIELFNSSDKEVILKDCIISSSAIGSKDYIFTDEKILPKSFFVLDISKSGLIIHKDSINEIFLLDPDKNEIQSVKFDPLDDGSAWAFFENDGVWKKTFKVTPGKENIFEKFMPCQPGEYRNLKDKCVKKKEEKNKPKKEKKCDEGYFLNPKTNRCNKIKSQKNEPQYEKICKDGYFLNKNTNRCNKIQNTLHNIKSCVPGYYLNTLTNRCNKISVAKTSTVTPCKPGYYRNEETGRCRKIQQKTDMKNVACKEGYERNPETNRCRKIVKNNGASDSVLDNDKETPKEFSGWWAIFWIIVVFLTILIWEFRKSLLNFFKKGKK